MVVCVDAEVQRGLAERLQGRLDAPIPVCPLNHSWRHFCALGPHWADPPGQAALLPTEFILHQGTQSPTFLPPPCPACKSTPCTFQRPHYAEQASMPVLAATPGEGTRHRSLRPSTSAGGNMPLHLILSIPPASSRT
ncbi:hypothetical protein ACKKBG_A09520 [Auxenochlorella protothecoides x Auxenochlorella symbiontica]